MTADLKPTSPRLSYNFNAATWQLYRKKLNDSLHRIDLKQTISTAQQIDTYAATLTKCIILATKTAIPQSNGTLKNLKI